MKAARIGRLIALTGALLLPSQSIADSDSRKVARSNAVTSASTTLSSEVGKESANDTVPIPQPLRAGTVVAVDDSGDVYTIALGDEVASVGSILQVYRRLPGERGTAPYRSSSVWWEIGQLTVTATSGHTAVATGEADPPIPLPSKVDESGAPAGTILIGDRVRATGGVGPRPSPVRVTFARSALFSFGEEQLGEDGTKFFRSWLRGLRSMEGPIQVEVRPFIEGLSGIEARQTSEAQRNRRNKDYPIGPSQESGTVPSSDLYEESEPGVQLPESRELLVVESFEGEADTWHYVDPVRLAQRQGERIAEALAAYLRIPSREVLVRVIPRSASVGASLYHVPGYEEEGEQVRIVATAIDYKQPDIEPEERRRRAAERAPPARRAPTTRPAAPKEPEQKPETPIRRRRLLERPPEVSNDRDREDEDGEASGG